MLALVSTGRLLCSVNIHVMPAKLRNRSCDRARSYIGLIKLQVMAVQRTKTGGDSGSY